MRTRKAQRARLLREVRLRVAVVAYGVRRLGPPLVFVALYLVGAALIVRWDLRRAGHPALDLGATAYAIGTQLFLEPTEPFPPTTVARVVFAVTPLVGFFLLAEGLLKVGASFIDRESREKLWMTIITENLRDHIVVCGLGHVGYRVIEELRALGEDVVAVDANQPGNFVEHARLLSIPVHVGDARRDDLLEAVGIARAKAVVCATGDDLANLEIALDAKRIHPAIRVVMRMFDQRLAGKVGGALDLDQSFSTSSLSAPLVAMQAREDGVRSAYRLGDVVRITADVPVRAAHGLSTVGDLEERVACRVVGHRRGDAPIAPARARDAIAVGDVLVVDVAARDLHDLRAALA